MFVEVITITQVYSHLLTTIINNNNKLITLIRFTHNHTNTKASVAGLGQDDVTTRMDETTN